MFFQECNLCNYKTEKWSNLERHRKTHEGVKCPVCKRKFRDDEHLQHHLKAHDKEPECPKCHKTFSTAFNLRKHVKNVHSDSPATRVTYSQGELPAQTQISTDINTSEQPGPSWRPDSPQQPDPAWRRDSPTDQQPPSRHPSVGHGSSSRSGEGSPQLGPSGLRIPSPTREGSPELVAGQAIPNVNYAGPLPLPDPIIRPFPSLLQNLPAPVQSEYRHNWSAIRTNYSLFGLAHRYNLRVSINHYPDLSPLIRMIYDQENTQFLVNVSLGFMLQRKPSEGHEDEDELSARYFWPSINRYIFDHNIPITRYSDISRFDEEVELVDLRTYALQKRESTQLRLYGIVNVRFDVYPQAVPLFGHPPNRKRKADEDLMVSAHLEV